MSPVQQNEIIKDENGNGPRVGDEIYKLTRIKDDESILIPDNEKAYLPVGRPNTLESRMDALEARILALEIDKVAQAHPLEFMQAVYVMEYLLIRTYFSVPDNIEHIYQLRPIISLHAFAPFLKDPDVVALLKILDSPEFNYVREHRNLIAHPLNMPNFDKLKKDLKYLQEAYPRLSVATQTAIKHIELHLTDLENIHKSVVGFTLVRPP